MKKILQFLGILVLLVILGLIIIFVFNPANSRDKLIANAINSYLSKQIDGYKAIPKEDRVPYEASNYNNPLIPDQQEKVLYDMGVDVASLPTEITPAMSKCFIEKLGQDRTTEIVNGAIPSAIDLFKAKDCL
ncbi:MAG: hypothetical protein WCS88_03090 [Patescibacteria group bacterium]|jgi:hypothetical protein